MGLTQIEAKPYTILLGSALFIEPMNTLLKRICNRVEQRGDEAILFLQELIRTPSLSHQEAEISSLISKKALSLGYDQVDQDDLFDVKMTINGHGMGRSLLFNGHIDHVPVGNMENPYSGRLMDGETLGIDGQVVYGRGASDMKAAVAAAIMAGAVLQDLGVKLRGDYKIAAVSQEEAGGAGTKATIRDGFLGDLVVVGEATDMNVALGHRAMIFNNIVVKGKSCHASNPKNGINAICKAVDLINRIRSEMVPKLPHHELFGETTMTFTNIFAKPGAINVVPEECSFTIDCRNTPNFSEQAFNYELQAIISSQINLDPELNAQILPIRGSDGFYTDPSKHKEVDEARTAIGEALVKIPKLTVWTFGTDGVYYSQRGVPVIGFGPGEERYAHSHEEHVKVSDYLEAIKAYAWLACKFCGVKKPN